MFEGTVQVCHAGLEKYKGSWKDAQFRRSQACTFPKRPSPREQTLLWFEGEKQCGGDSQNLWQASQRRPLLRQLLIRFKSPLFRRQEL